MVTFTATECQSSCTCGYTPGYHCGSRVNDTDPETNTNYLTGPCNSNIQYQCTQNNQPATIVRVCPGVESTNRCIKGKSPGNDNCGGRGGPFARKLNNQ